MTPGVITRVRHRDGVGRLPRRRTRRSKIRLALSGRPRSRFSRISASKNTRPESRSTSTWVRENFGLQDRQLVAVAGAAVGPGEGVRQPRQPAAKERVDLRRRQPVADALQPVGVIAVQEAVVQRGERDPGRLGLALRPVVAVEAQLHPVREVARDLAKKRAEVEIRPVGVVLVDQRRWRARSTDSAPRSRGCGASRSETWSSSPAPRRSCRSPRPRQSARDARGPRRPCADPSKKRTTGIFRSAANRWIEATNCLLIGSARHVEAKLAPR